MRLFGLARVRTRILLAALALVFQAAVVDFLWTPTACAQRVFGLDTSSIANGSNIPTQTMWNNSFNDADGDGIAYKFAFVRSSRGGTSDATRLDDGHFYDNITRGTTAGLLVGSYHFTRADVTTHTAADDANHYLERAGMYMKPGYLLPVYDLESGNTLHSQASLTAWGMEFMNTIFNAKDIWPIVYTNSSYNNDEVGAELAFFNFGSTPKTNPRTFQWVARPSGSLTTGEPGAAVNYPNPYGAWDPNFVTRTNSRDPAINPWAFWQNGSGSPNGFLIDFNAANGNIEFVKDFLVPALWTNAGSGDWGTTSNWNSDNPTYNGTIQSGPAPRLPNNQSLDWVKLQNSGGGTVTISSGARTVRKFYTQQPLNITGGSLSVGYTPGGGGKWDLPSEFNAAVTLSPGASYSAHTTQIDGGGGVFNINGGIVTFRELQLASHASNSGKIVMGGDATFAHPGGGSGTSVIRSIGSLAQPGSMSLTAGNRTFSINNGAAGVDLNVRVGISGAGRLDKAGAGTMQLSMANTYDGGTTISSGVLQIAVENRLGATPGSLQSNNIILNGGTLRTGSEINSAILTNPGSGYTSFPTVTIGGAGASVHMTSVNVLAGVSSIAVTGGGSGYVNQNPVAPPTFNTAGTFVDVVGGGGTGATAYATVVGGVVTAVNIANPGTGYTSMPTIHISSTAISGVAGNGATASVNGITLQGLALGDGGFDYTTPTISLTGGGGSGATAAAVATAPITLNSNRGVELTANGGTLHQTNATVFTIDGPISSSGNGVLTKTGPGTLVLSGANTYTGGTVVSDGLLVATGADATLGSGDVTMQNAPIGAGLLIQSSVVNAIDDAAALSLFGGGAPNVADAGFAFLEPGINEVVGSLVLNGVAQLAGTYGSSSSSALYKNDEYFSGTGILSIIDLPGDFNVDGIVDAADFVMWQKYVGQPAGSLPNDTTGMAIGNDQYQLWTTNFGNTSPGSGGGQSDGAVPEPSSVAMLMLALTGLFGHRRTR